MLRTIITAGQKIALALGLPLLLFLGLRVHKGEEDNLAADAKLAFGLLTVIMLVLTGGLWSELAIRWPLPLAVVFLALLATALFCPDSTTEPVAKKPGEPREGNGTR